MPFVKSKPPLPTRSSRSLRAAASSTSSALCLHHSHPFEGLLATVGWKWGCQPFSCCPCTLCVTHCRKEICSTCLFHESMPFGKSKPPLPTRSLRSLRAAARSTSSALCLHHSHPFVQLPMCSKCDALPKGNLWDMLVGFRNPFPLFFSSKDELVRVKY